MEFQFAHAGYVHLRFVFPAHSEPLPVFSPEPYEELRRRLTNLQMAVALRPL